MVRKLKIAASATFTCPTCHKNSRIKVPEKGTLYIFECKKCKSAIETHPSKCCIICAYTNKKCTPSVELHNNMIKFKKTKNARKI